MDVVRRTLRPFRALGPALEVRPWLVLLAAALIALPTIALGEVAAADTRTRLRDAQLQAQDAAARRAAARVSFILADVADHLVAATRPGEPLITAAASGDRRAIQNAVISLAAGFTYTPGYYFVDALGVIRAGSTAGAPTGPLARVIGQRSDTIPWADTPSSRVGASMMTAEQMTRTFSKPDVYLSDFYVAHDRSGSLLAFGTSTGSERPGEQRLGYEADMATRVMVDGKLAGALVAVIDPSPFVDAVFELHGIAQHAYLVDRTGRLIRRMRYLDRNMFGTDLSTAEAVNAAVRGAHLDGEGPDPSGEGEALLTSIPIAGISGNFGADLTVGWTIIAAEPLAHLYGEVDAGAGTLRALRIALVAAILGLAGMLTVAVQSIARQRLALASANLSLDAASREIAAAARHKSEFLANMSHELRTPLNAIIGFSDVLLERMFGELNPKQTEYLTDISTSGNHLLSLVNDVLDLSKVEAGRLELEPSDFSVADAVAAAMTLVRERAVRHGIELSAVVPTDLPLLHADVRKVRQILLNLLSNAVKSTPEGGRVSIDVRRSADELVISVRDTGIGISADDQMRVFDEFRQVGSRPDLREEGTGLGLTLTKRFVELHGGRIWVESTPGKGSTFSFTLPLHQPAAVRA